MDKIICFFLNQEFFVINATIHSKNYVTIECLYPLQNIKADYYEEDTDFNQDFSFPLVKVFSHQVLYSFYMQYRFPERLLDYFSENDICINSTKVDGAIRSYSEITYFNNVDLKFYSKDVQELLHAAHLQYASHKTLPFTDLWGNEEEEYEMEKVQEIILKNGVSEILFFNYKDEAYQGINFTKTIFLSKERFPEERLLQELFICKYSAPRMYQDENPFLKPYFQERFNTFSDQKKMGLFLVCNTNKELYLYNKCLTRYWMNRY